MRAPTTTLVAWALVLVASVSVMSTLKDYGVVWDEGFYFPAGDSYLEWLSSPSLSSIDEFWSVSPEHPPLTMILGGMTRALFHERLGWFDEHVAYRISLLVFIVLMTAAFFAFSRAYLGLWAAAFASLALMFHPRLFFHAHIGALDYAITTMWFACAYALWKSEKSMMWTAVAAVALGLALLTKINGVALYLVVGLLLLAQLMPGARISRRGLTIGPLAPTKHLFVRVLMFAVIPLLVFYVGWPWIWQSPIARVSDFVAFHTRHFVIPTFYFGTQYRVAPWHVPPVLTLLATPTFIVGLFLVGLFSSVLPTRVRVFVVGNLVLALAVIVASPSKHDGMRLFLPAVPFFYLVAGAGLVGIYRQLEPRVAGWNEGRHFPATFAIVASVLLAVSMFLSVVRYHPYQTAYFNAVVGGDRGAVRKGFEDQGTWCSPYVEALDWLDQRADSRFWTPVCGHVFDYYHSAGLMRRVLSKGDEGDSDYLILPSRFGVFTAAHWDYYRNETPVFSVTAYEENVLNIYSLDKNRVR